MESLRCWSCWWSISIQTCALVVPNSIVFVGCGCREFTEINVSYTSSMVFKYDKCRIQKEYMEVRQMLLGTSFHISQVWSGVVATLLAQTTTRKHDKCFVTRLVCVTPVRMGSSFTNSLWELHQTQCSLLQSCCCCCSHYHCANILSIQNS